ncbi:hypothetical protein jhhlp_001325 [Lomentospora prolificans]|uniref:Uncharacterized protein n=1 Tax=Lomentospora prolificans TaxID=41688 RepID=A0A2N3NHU1_9PEZI|nr:hypothetical protein jhhlp_001325 [Lomentospora prolificans]
MTQRTQNDAKSAELDAVSEEPQQSMSKASSGGAEASTKEGMADTSSSSPYGTRSRNRTGNSRPNYAEDKDMDLDFDYYPPKKETELKKSTRQNSASAVAPLEPPRTGGPSRKSGAEETKDAASQNGTREQNSTPQTAPNHGANGTGASQSSSKKRKSTAQSGNSTPAHSTTQSASASGPSKRLASQSASHHSGTSFADTNMLSFSNCNATPKDGKLVADDGTVLAPNDHVYLVCEPPGEPYYIGRIMEFLHIGNDPSKPVDALRINWYYRPKDIGRRVQDTRLLFATMHSDISPLTALRGKCEIRHRSEIKSPDEYRKTPDCFWYEKLYDRYIQKNYDLIPTASIINVPEKVKKVLDERWKFVLVEQGRGKELTSAMKLCKKCGAYCASNDSVDCSDCKLTYHMNCVTPPVTKKPSRGFGWSCAACSRKHEKKLHARNTPSILDNDVDLDDEELNEEEEAAATTQTGTPSVAADDDEHIQGTPEQIYQASLWPYRYLGQHCKVEDALDYDDRIYPRASSRIGPKHQATVLAWPGRPVIYEPVLEFKRAGKRDTKLSKENQAALEAQKIRRETRPKWVQDEPPGYTERGGDHDSNDPNCTATLLWKPPSQETLPDSTLKEYTENAMAMADTLGVPAQSTNLQNIALVTLYKHNFNVEEALDALSKTELEAFKEPNLTPAEQKKFEEAVMKYGSELHTITKHVKSLKHGDIVRHYYIWKKTERGKQIWGDYSGRKGRKEAKKAEEEANKLQEDLADDLDDSAFDSGKAADRKKNFICKFCSTKSSRQWRRAPASASASEGGGKASGKDKKDQYVVALCRRCAELWRRYGIQWEDIEEMAKKVAQAGGRAWKRKQDEELLKELIPAKDLPSLSPPAPDSSSAHANGMVVGGSQNGEPPRKKLKGFADDRSGTESAPQTTSKRKEKVSEKSRATPPVALPEPKTLPCAVCNQLEPLGDQLLSCRECRLSVHRNCYGVVDTRTLTKPGKWICDTCTNDRSPQVSLNYKCVLCSVEHTEHDFVGHPKPSGTGKKKSDKDRDREKGEREQAQKAADYYRKKQEEANRPVNPREPLKRTADNNWVHVTCAVWTPEVKFGSGEALVPAEGIASIPRARFEEVCVVCNKAVGACVSCNQCRTPVHVECARQRDYVLGFDITPIKGSRRDQFQIVTINGESGVMSSGLWCRDHAPTKTIVHRMYDVVDEGGLNALQLYAQNFKQADRSITDTVRKANLVTAAAKVTGSAASTGVRRASTTALPVNGTSTQRQASEPGSVPHISDSKICITCGIDVSPKWWAVEDSPDEPMVNGFHDELSDEAKKFVEQRKFQCHKCHKTNRKPKPLRESPPPPPPEQVHLPMVSHRQPTPPVQAPNHLPRLASSPPQRPAETHRFLWATTAPPAQHSPAPIAAPIAVPHVQAAPPPPPPQPQPQQQPPPQAPPPSHITHLAGPPSMPPMHQYPPPAPYNDWHSRSSAQHSPPARHLNGDHHQRSPVTGLSALRPPPLSVPPSVPPPVSSIHQGAHLGQALVNGLPPSPLRSGGPQVPPPNPYIHPYHPHPGVSHHLSNGTPPPPPPASLPPRGPDHLSQGLLSRGSPYGPSHASPPLHSSQPVARDGGPLIRESPPVLPPPPQRPPESRPPSGASASPSLRNLLL